MQRKVNFSGGPGALPDSAIFSAAKAIELVPEVGLSLLGISHRSAWCKDMMESTEQLVRDLLKVPEDYKVIFMQGGSSLLFHSIPFTFARRVAPPDYITTGYWSGRALEAAQHACPITPPREIWRNPVPPDPHLDAPQFDWRASYLHYVSNETVDGVQFNYIPGLNSVHRVCDMSSDLFTRPVDVGRYDLIYAHAQKNIGPAGVTVVIMSPFFYAYSKSSSRSVPPILSFAAHADAKSLYNTPPVAAIYITKLVLEWLREEVGGLTAMQNMNGAKASRLYSTIDTSGGFYTNPVPSQFRSLVNVVFDLPTPGLTQRFLLEAESEDMVGLAGHRSRGGVRASLYNAVTLLQVEQLACFMRYFQAQIEKEGDHDIS